MGYQHTGATRFDQNMTKQSPMSDTEWGAMIHRAPAVARAATVLRLIAGERSGLGVTEIARRVGLVPSTALHVLRALVDEGFISFDTEKKTYRTGVGLLTLIRDAMTNSEFPKAVQPALDQLATDHHMTTVGLELDNRDRIVVVALARSDTYVSLHVNVGSRFPSLISATGRCVAAASGLSKDELRDRFEKLQWERAPRFEQWYAEVEKARAEGASVDRGSYIRGLSIASALLPIGADRVRRGIALIGFEHQMTERTIRTVKDDLIEATRSVAAGLH
jgi:DNA-binding IclR family transcriptional regulator